MGWRLGEHPASAGRSTQTARETAGTWSQERLNSPCPGPWKPRGDQAARRHAEAKQDRLPAEQVPCRGGEWARWLDTGPAGRRCPCGQHGGMGEGGTAGGACDGRRTSPRSLRLRRRLVPSCGREQSGRTGAVAQSGRGLWGSPSGGA